MNEISRKRREWVKTAAIIFLTVMLVLTFFSNTIMNYSLPEVAAQYVQSGTITAKIRGNGVVESSDPYNVMVKQTRKVMSVAVKSGDVVQQGDVLVYLEDTESEELKAALEALETAQETYDLALLTADMNASMVQNAHKDVATSTYRQQITNAQNEVKAAEKEYKEWLTTYNTISNELTMTQADAKNLAEEIEEFNEAQEDLNEANRILTAAKNKVSELEAQIDYYNNVVSGGDMVALEQELIVAKQEVLDATKLVNNASEDFQAASDELAEEKAEGDNSNAVGQISESKAEIEIGMNLAKEKLTEKEEALLELTENINKTLNLESLYKDIADAQELVDEETEKSTDSVVKADIAGTITQINAVAGKEISAAEAVAIIQPEGKGYTMSFTVTNEQAKRLAVGDKAELINSWYYDEMDVTLASIKPDPSNPGKQKLLTFDVTGGVTAGQTLNVSVGQKSANYDLIVPNSAIREDNNGKFVLTVESKSSPLGNRYIATRVDVEVIAGDDTQSAISGALYGYEFVITTSTKPVEAGQQVRLAEN
ncbi:MAG: HlyD family efflux transporter periplasmic adaptor subunit [Lachnospiraceae bacterium]|nr:HlyD family efflux transporter periplasmic adaptor subunit [Lachnospiraceae bacterium]